MSMKNDSPWKWLDLHIPKLIINIILLTVALVPAVLILVFVTAKTTAADISKWLVEIED